MADIQNNPKVGFLEHLESHPTFRYIKWVMFFLLVIGIVVLYNYVRDTQAKLVEEQQKRATLEQNFQQLGTSAVSKNELTSKLDAQKAVIDAQGNSVAQYMARSNTTLDSLTRGLGTIEGRVSELNGKLSQTDFSSHQDQQTGALTGFDMNEVRTSFDGKQLPSLSAVRLFYDPKQRDPNVAFKGTTWRHNKEIFKPSFAEWQEDKGGKGFKRTLSLSREVYTSDPTDPTKTVLLGTEDIPITGSDTIFTPETFKQAGKISNVPRWTVSFGVSKDQSTLTTQGGYKPAGFVDYRFTDRFGAFAGSASNNVVGGLSWRFGK